MNYVNIEHVKAFVTSAKASEDKLYQQFDRIASSSNQSIANIQNWTRSNFPGLFQIPIMPCTFHPKDENVLMGECPVGQEFLKSELAAGMFKGKDFEPVNHAYYFDYSAANKTAETSLAQQTTSEQRYRLGRFLEVLIRHKHITATTDLALGYVYRNNCVPCVTYGLDQHSYYTLHVKTPVGLSAGVSFEELHYYPEICQNVVWFVDKKMQELGISLQAYTAAVQEIGETLFKIHTARLANNPNRSAVFAQSFKENQSLRIEIVPRPYFASDDDPEFTTNVKFMGYDEDNLKPSPAAMYAVITQKDDLLKPLNEELTSYTPKE